MKESVQSKLEELAERAKKAASESGENLKERLNALENSEEWEQLKKVASEMGDDAAVFVRKYPLQSVAGAAALGFVLGAFLGRRK
ncbi:MAG TPA: hypothetical protein VIH99_03700 [Bdellovibrionota bacterium]|jgi:ElaB/YqjD/DUF883 family membrane-anchored ribosome-binding protein